MYEHHNLVILKSENPAAYKRLAEEGIMVAHPVSINGQDTRPDIGIGYHSTVKFFDPSKDHPTSIHDVARGLKMPIPDPHKTAIEPSTFKDRFGNDVYVVKLHGEHADQMRANNEKFSHMGFPVNYEFKPHISVDKNTWDRIVSSGAKTAHEAGISFGPAQLKQGYRVLTTYKHGAVPVATQENEPLAASEKMEGEQLSKGLKHMASAAAIAGVIGLAQPVKDATPAINTQQQSSANQYDSGKMLRAIASVESSGGKFTNHRMLNGHPDGDQAYGKYGLMPNTIRETIRMNRDLKSKYSKVQSLDGSDLKHFMQDNPGLEDKIAAKHLARLEHHFGKDPAKLGYSWLNGIQGTYKATKENKDIKNHWHVVKIKDAYGREK